MEADLKPKSSVRPLPSHCSDQLEAVLQLGALGADVAAAPAAAAFAAMRRLSGKPLSACALGERPSRARRTATSSSASSADASTSAVCSCLLWWGIRAGREGRCAYLVGRTSRLWMDRVMTLQEGLRKRRVREDEGHMLQVGHVGHLASHLLHHHGAGRGAATRVGL